MVDRADSRTLDSAESKLALPTNNSEQVFSAQDLLASATPMKTALAETQTSIAKTSAADMLNGFSLEESTQSIIQPPPMLMAEARCATGWATIYGTTGNPMADGTPYTGREQGVAIDMRTPVLDSQLGDRLVITNLNNNRSTTQIARDRGGFGNPREYGTPDGQPRLVDLTYAAANRIGAGDMTPVRVCKVE
ncbi:MAG TPA: hypothetical protein PLC15_23230 [Candidatus Obscuribacter sp.]|nr:hypothetical protein [Candidatus Obscuribacter sp.]HNB18321.1 hypothetical protein [Candidatus Obscuribacter sp.]HNG75829.1 hypothetical protein [Candidatus Obscuribacter sp.]